MINRTETKLCIQETKDEEGTWPNDKVARKGTIETEHGHGTDMWRMRTDVTGTG